MKSIKELNDERKLKRDKKHEQNELLEVLKGSAKHNTDTTIEAIARIKDHWADMSAQQQMESMMMISEIVKSIPKPELSISFNGGLKNITTESMTVTGLDKAMEGLVSHMEDMRQEVRDIEIKMPDINVPDVIVPEIKIPTINVPAPQVTVQAPEVNVTVPDIKIPDQIITVNQVENTPKTIEVKKDRFGRWQEIVEVYDTGKVVTKRNKDGLIEIDDRRKKVS